MRWLFLCLALVGCGDDAMFGGKKDKGGGSDELAPASDPATPRPQYFATAAAMPACTAENQDWLVYVADEKKLKACLAGAWTDVETSPADAPQNPFTPELQYSCSASVDLDADPDSETTGVMTTVTKFSNGDWAITCMDRVVHYSFVFVDSTTNQGFFRSGSNGVQAGIVTCLGYYANVTYTIATNIATWAENGGASSADTACEALQ